MDETNLTHEKDDNVIPDQPVDNDNGSTFSENLTHFVQDLITISIQEVQDVHNENDVEAKEVPESDVVVQNVSHEQFEGGTKPENASHSTTIRDGQKSQDGDLPKLSQVETDSKRSVLPLVNKKAGTDFLPSQIDFTGLTRKYVFHLPPVTGPNTTGRISNIMNTEDVSTVKKTDGPSSEVPPFRHLPTLVKPEKFTPYTNRETYKSLPPLSSLPSTPKPPYPLSWGVPILSSEARTNLSGYVCPEAFKFQKGQPMSMTSYITRRHYNRLCVKPTEWIPVPMRK